MGLLALATALAGCGGSSSSSPPAAETATITTPAPATTRSLSDYGKDYLRIIGPPNDALDTLNQKAKSYIDDTTAEEIAADTEPLADTIEEASNALLRVDWPASVKYGREGLRDDPGCPGR
jgi:hypothetical protein